MLLGWMLVASLITPARADFIPPCRLPDGVVSTSLLTEAPGALQQALKQRVGAIAQTGARFDATDVVVTGRNRRLIFVWHRGGRWIVATEHGGRGYNDPIFAYDLGAEHQDPTLVAERVAFPNTVCSLAAELLELPPAP